MRVEPIRDLEDILRMEHVLRYYSYRYWIAWKIGVNSALRMGDICKLKVKTVRERYVNTFESKTGKFRRWYINDDIRPILDDYIRYMDDEDYLLRNINNNEQPRPSSIYRIFHDCGKKLGMPHIGTHTCRKTFAYHHYRENKNIALLMEILNHDSQRETLIYIGVMQDEIDQAFATTFL